MPATNPIKTPAGYVPAFALGFSGPTGDLEIVDSVKALPVEVSSTDPLVVLPYAAPPPAAIEGTSASNVLVGPFVPATGRPVVLTLAGTWEGEVQLKRSSDGGTTPYPLTAWARYVANACEPVWEE